MKLVKERLFLPPIMLATNQNLKYYNDTFRKELARLNPAQRKAVEQIEGPVLVIAGPGTGKTHILTARIGRILLETDAQPHNILCLTFTDAGVHAMRERLLEFIGPEAHRVHIYTFHSFCNSIIEENLELFGEKIIGKDWNEIKKILENNKLNQFENEVVDGTENYFFEDNWLFVNVDYDKVFKIEIGAVFNNNDEFDWKFKSKF